MRRCTPGSQVASQLARAAGRVFFRAQFFRQRMHGAHIDVALGLLVQQAALVGADHQGQRAVGQGADQFQLETLGDLLRGHAVALVIAVDDQAQAAPIHVQLLQFLQQAGQRHQRAHALVGHDPVLLRSARQAGHEIRIVEAAGIGHHHAEMLAQPLEHQQRIGLRDIAHLAQIARQGQHAQAVGRVRHRRAQQGRIQAAQVARGLGEIEVAADVQIELAIAHRPTQVQQRHAAGQRLHGAGLGGFGRLGAASPGTQRMRLFHAVLHQAGQVHGQRAGAHARTGAQQQHAAPLAVGAPAAGDGRVQQALHHVLHFLRRDRGIDEIADPRRARRRWRLRAG